MQRNVTATFDLGDKLIQAKDMQDAVKIQFEFFQEQMRTLTDQARICHEGSERGVYSEGLSQLSRRWDSAAPLGLARRKNLISHNRAHSTSITSSARVSSSMRRLMFRQRTESDGGDQIDSIAFIHEYVADSHGCTL